MGYQELQYHVLLPTALRLKFLKKQKIHLFYKLIVLEFVPIYRIGSYFGGWFLRSLIWTIQ